MYTCTCPRKNSTLQIAKGDVNRQVKIILNCWRLQSRNDSFEGAFYISSLRISHYFVFFWAIQITWKKAQTSHELNDNASILYILLFSQSFMYKIFCDYKIRALIRSGLALEYSIHGKHPRTASKIAFWNESFLSCKFEQK